MPHFVSSCYGMRETSSNPGFDFLRFKQICKDKAC